MRLTLGTRLGPHEVVSPLGAGGMGEVYRAHDIRLGRDVAVKVIPAELALDPERIRRFEQEARAAGALSHPNVCAIYDIGTHEGSPFVVMELLEGETLRETCLRTCSTSWRLEPPRNRPQKGSKSSRWRGGSRSRPHTCVNFWRAPRA